MWEQRIRNRLLYSISGGSLLILKADLFAWEEAGKGARGMMGGRHGGLFITINVNAFDTALMFFLLFFL